MGPRIPFRTVEPAFFAGLLDDPVLLLNIRPTGRGVLIDCGRVHHLAKRVMKSIDVLFVTHAHMDHFMGIDTVIRHNHVSPRTLELFGPPGMAEKMTAKFSSYDWNLTEQYWCSFRVHEVHQDFIATFLFPGPEGFPCRPEGKQPRLDKVIYRNGFLQVEADLCDHKIPVLIFRITERPSFLIDVEKMMREGFVGGPWLRQLKKRFYHGGLSGEPLTVLRVRDGRVAEEAVKDVVQLYKRIRKEQPPSSIGYVTDIGFTEENLDRVFTLFRDVTLLVCECSFLAVDRDKARVSSHLCTSDVNFLLARLRPPFFLPMHLSKSYIHDYERIYEELEIPGDVTLLRLPKYLTPRPLLTYEAARLGKKWTERDTK
jgi:ribonuclease Z